MILYRQHTVKEWTARSKVAGGVLGKLIQQKINLCTVTKYLPPTVPGLPASFLEELRQ